MRVLTVAGSALAGKVVNWLEIAHTMGNGRSAKQCRDRWQNYLRPGLKKGQWTKAEEIQIMEMYHSMGPK